MISILIPVFNQTVTGLVRELREQGQRLNISYEVIVLDDGSESSIVDQNRVVGQWENVTFITGSRNIGRAAARNQLAKLANYTHLLFIDCDAAVLHGTYLSNYLENMDKGAVVCGGTAYQATPPEKKEFLFRWKYGKKRESVPAKQRRKNSYAGFSSFNFLINKDLFLSIQFDEKLRQYGHEDTLFGYELGRRGSHVLHIDNPLLHLGLEPGQLFIRKTEAGLKNLFHLTRLYGESREFIKLVKLLRVFYRLQRSGMLPLPESFTRRLVKMIEKRLLAADPNLLLFDLYKLLYYSSLYF